jgi:hypothetical protein
MGWIAWVILNLVEINWILKIEFTVFMLTIAMTLNRPKTILKAIVMIARKSCSSPKIVTP